MATYKTPGVYVEEIKSLPSSIVPVETAVPVFIGYTQKAERGTVSLTGVPTRITSFGEFESLFGQAYELDIEFEIHDTTSGSSLVKREFVIIPKDSKGYFLYYQVKMYFENGGGPCYILSMAGYGPIPTYTLLNGAWPILEKVDEPTLIVLPDAPWTAVGAVDPIPYGNLIISALTHCNKMKDRFLISDVRTNTVGNVGSEYRENIGTSNLKNGAAYFPYLNTNIEYPIKESAVKFFKYYQNGSEVTPGTPLVPLMPFSIDQTLENIKNGVVSVAPNNQLYNQIKEAIGRHPLQLGPCGAIAGVYCSVDRERGVWKAPANVSLNRVIAPAITITNEDQDGLNVDVTAGKSINVIRAFTGRGTLVWGSRTLAGNDNEWRYVPVRRLFIMIEESIQKATQSVVFEPNDAHTWSRMKAMIENFLNTLWRQGALAGVKPQHAYFVNVGLGTTMSPLDILEGRMIVEVGIAAVRPAEFIILKFSHKIQES